MNKKELQALLREQMEQNRDITRRLSTSPPPDQSGVFLIIGNGLTGLAAIAAAFIMAPPDPPVAPPTSTDICPAIIELYKDETPNPVLLGDRDSEAKKAIERAFEKCVGSLSPEPVASAKNSLGRK